MEAVFQTAKERVLDSEKEWCWGYDAFYVPMFQSANNRILK